MKKNKFLKLASGLLVLCLLTTCVISTTFAKYTTSGDAQDTARVAQWGVTITAQNGGTDGFATSYGTTVKSSTTDKLVAPGTDAELAEFTIAGVPEVSLNLNIEFTDTEDVFLKTKTGYKDWTQEEGTYDLANDYYPVVYTLKFVADTTNGTGADATLATGNLDAIITKINTLNGDYAVASADWTNILGTYTITWAWDFDAAGAGTNDKADTTLGNLAAGLADSTVATADYNLDIHFEIDITATQID